MEDSELVERARSGDVDAYAALVRRYQDIAFRTAYLVTRNSTDAEEAAQEALTKAYFALGRFRAGAPFRPWLLTIVANEARNRRKASARHQRLALRIADGSMSGSIVPSPETLALAADQRAALLEALESLREEERLAIIYRYFLDLSEAEMAEMLGCARGTVKSRLSRALGRLRARWSSPAELTERVRGAIDG